MTKATVLTDRFDRALLYATHVHGGQVRKGTSTPYVAHLLAVAATVLEYGGDEDSPLRHFCTITLKIRARRGWMMFATGSARAWRVSWKSARIVSPIRGKGSARHIIGSEGKLISRTCGRPTRRF